MSFKDKVVLVTGASAGIGKATAIHFSKEKAKLIIIGRNQKALDEVKAICTKNSGREALSIQADVSKDDEVKRIVETVQKHHSGLDVLVNNAAAVLVDDIFTATLETYDAHINTNLRSVFNLTRLFVPLLVKAQGNIINISGVEAVKFCPGMLTESVSKAAIQHFTKYIAKELAPKKVRSNSLALGYVVGSKNVELGIVDADEMAKMWIEQAPLKEVIKQEEVAVTIAFLASNAARHITGQNIVMDGGYSIY